MAMKCVGLHTLANSSFDDSIVLVSAGGLATTLDGQRAAVLEHTGTSVVLFSGQDWQQPVAALAISQFASGPISETFLPSLSWDPGGSILALLTSEGQLIVIDGVHFRSLFEFSGAAYCCARALDLS